MTNAPECLLAPRRLLLTHLEPHGLAPAEVGIVGDPNHRGGYHCGSDRVTANDYSVHESPRDKAGLTLDASGLDVGTFSYRDPSGRVHNLRTFSTWCVRQCEAGAADTRDIREIIYSPDGKVVRRWDRLKIRFSGDSSHLWHTHFSFFRDATKAGRGPTALFRRYLTSIGLIQEDDMQLTDPIKLVVNKGVDYSSPTTTVAGVLASTNYYVLQTRNKLLAAEADQKLRDQAILAAVSGDNGEAVIAAVKGEGDRIRAELAAQATEAAARDARIVELIELLESGGATAQEVLVELRDLLPAA